jgi:hypothetical protein
MARRKTYSFAAIVAALMATACGESDVSGTDQSSPELAEGEPNPGDPNGDFEDNEPVVDPTFPTEHPRIYLAANRDRLVAALADRTPGAVKFKQRVDQWVDGGDLWGFRAWNAALMGQLTGEAKYCRAAIADVEAQVLAAEAAAAGGNRPEVTLDSYLHIGDMVGDVALVYDWCYSDVAPAQRTRWLAYANQAVWNVWHHPEATWGGFPMPWNGWSIDNPSCNYYYSFLRATMLVGLAAHGESDRADAWLTKFRDDKILGQLVPIFDEDLDGGGSREGTGYGVSMRQLFELYDFWKATTGENLATRTRHGRESIMNFVHQTMPTRDRLAPTGDHSRDSTAVLFDYDRQYIQELIHLYAKVPAAGAAKTLIESSSVPKMAQGFMAAYDFLYENRDVEARPLDDLPTSYFAPGIGVLYARSGWDTHATWVNMIAGPYTETHAHQDQGSIMIFKDGFLAYDPIIDSRSGIDQRTDIHSLVRVVDGGQAVKQIVGTTSEVVALHEGEGWLHVAADLTGAYAGHAAIQRIQREMIYLAPDAVIVFDRVSSKSGTTQTWQLATPVMPAVSGATATVTNAGHALRVTRIAPAGATFSTYDFRSESDFLAGARLDVTQPGGDNRYLHVLGVDGAVTSATAAGANAVTVRLSNGRTVTAAFNHDAPGGTLTIDGAATQLTATVDVLKQ